MRFVPTFFHGIADYIVGLLVLALPFLIAVVDPAARTTIMAVGILVLLYSAMTDYELGLIHFFRIRFHLLLDGIFGLVMLALPFVIDIPVGRRWPFYILGILAIGLVATTKIRAEGTAS